MIRHPQIQTSAVFISLQSDLSGCYTFTHTGYLSAHALTSLTPFPKLASTGREREREIGRKTERVNCPKTNLEKLWEGNLCPKTHLQTSLLHHCVPSSPPCPVILSLPPELKLFKTKLIQSRPWVPLWVESIYSFSGRSGGTKT